MKYNRIKNDDILNILLDDKNDSDIILKDVDNNDVTFEQVAVIPFNDEYTGENKIYCILHPINKTKEFNPNFFYSFVVEKDKDGSYGLTPVVDEDELAYIENEFSKLEV